MGRVFAGLFLFILMAGLVAGCARRGASTPSPAPPPTPPPPTPQEENSLLQQFLQLTPGEWRTNLQRRSIPLEEIVPGGPGKDGIPAIDRPQFIPPKEAEAWLHPQEPVISLGVGKEVKAYPLQILLWHEIVNDAVGGQPVAVTFCPLCNVALVFDRRVEGKVYTFGVSGFLRYSDLIMYDRQTDSWWQQATGEAIVGELTGKKLDLLPASIISWADFRKAHPRGQVLSRDTGFRRPYGENPYVGYDRIDQPPFLFFGKLDERLPPMERVVAVRIGETAVAFPFSSLRETKVIHHRVAGQDLVVFYEGQTLSPLDQEVIRSSQAVGAAAVFSRRVEGRALSFEATASGFIDRGTGSTWSIAGRAVGGPLAGKALTPVVHWNSFWFAWAAFLPQTQVYR